MSAYGPSAPRSVDSSILPTQILDLKSRSDATEGSGSTHLAVYHLTAQTIPYELSTYLYETFQDELDSGSTYPQEYPMTRSGFDVYFLGNDLFVGILVWGSHAIDYTLERAQNGREWNACVGGTYYVSMLHFHFASCCSVMNIFICGCAGA